MPRRLPSSSQEVISRNPCIVLFCKKENKQTKKKQDTRY